MDDTTRHTDAKAAEWAAILEESEAELAAGLTVSGEEIMRELHESLARMEGQKAATEGTGTPHGSTPER